MRTFFQGLDALEARRQKNNINIMFRHSHHISNLVLSRPGIELRSNKKVKFKSKVTLLTKLQKGPYYQGGFHGTDWLWEYRKPQPRSSLNKV